MPDSFISFFHHVVEWFKSPVHLIFYAGLSALGWYLADVVSHEIFASGQGYRKALLHPFTQVNEAVREYGRKALLGEALFALTLGPFVAVVCISVLVCLGIPGWALYEYKQWRRKISEKKFRAKYKLQS